MTRPSEPRPDAAAMLRVNQAGEYGATRIYAGQLAVLRKDSPAAHAIADVIGRDELHEDYVIPSVFDRRVAKAVADAVRASAQQTGVARRTTRGAF